MSVHHELRLTKRVDEASRHTQEYSLEHDDRLEGM